MIGKRSTVMRSLAAVLLLSALAASAHAASPFGIATPDSPGGGFGGPLGPFFVQIAYYQSIFYRHLTHALTGMKSNGWEASLLLALSFAYGVFHAAGPGHGKAVISAYMISSGETVKRGIALSFLSAFVQAVSAVLIVSIAAIVFQVTAVTMTRATDWFEILSYALVAIVGAWLLWTKAVGGGHHHHHHVHAAGDGDDDHVHGHGHHHHDEHDHHHHDDGHHDYDHGHAHAPAGIGAQRVAPTLTASRSWRETLTEAWSAILAVGVRPCSGAIIVLVFALSQGLFLAGVAATFVMALGTGLTVAILAVLAVTARSAAVRLSGIDSPLAARVTRAAEILAAAAVLVLGLILLGGSLAHGLPG